MRVNIWNAARRPKLSFCSFTNARFVTTDSRNRLSNFWAPTGGISPQDREQDDSHALLIRGGFLRQAHSGVFHLLPLGLRVQDKLESLISKHMSSIGASKTSLSSITTETLWKQSGRYSSNSELLRLKDRKDSGFLLSPTHEEEITSLVAGIVHSHKVLPLRLYQVGRKYRDERRPRGGLLRAKEFMMKDLYTFDSTPQHALATYEAVRSAYNNIFNELKIPYLVADADSGNMGGKLSHEYHFVSSKGEDNVWSCDSCTYIANEELVAKKIAVEELCHAQSEFVFTGITQDRSTKVNICIPRPSHLTKGDAPSWSQVSEYVNLHAVKRAGIDLDTGIETETLASVLLETTQTISIRDVRLLHIDKHADTSPSTDLAITHPGDPCPRCTGGQLHVQKAIEVGHTFHLGTRYSVPLNALVAVPDSPEKKAIEMGCHGIGVSRLIGAIASILSDSRGLNWPRVVAPFEVVIVTTPQISEDDDIEVYDALLQERATQRGTDLDVLLDDRPIKSLAWKLQDADLIGYPVVVVIGRTWKETREVEVQCRRLGVKEYVTLERLQKVVIEILDQL